MCTGAVTSLGAHLPAFYAFVVPVMAPYLAMCLHRGDTVHVAVAFVVAFYLAALAFFARNYQHSIAESWRLHFENLRLMEQLAARKEEAERANVAKSRFLAAASHDLRQPLHAMALFISALKDKNRDAEVGAIVDRLAKSVESLEDLFHALLDISRLDAGTVRPELHTFPVQSLLDGIAGDFAAEAAEKDLRFRVVPCRAFVTSDRLLLDRIVRNLVANAIRYTQTGGVVIGCRRRRASVRIDIGDTGVGIASAHLPDIFQEFYQIDNPARDRSRGLGLGLAIVDRLSRLLNHAVSVRSIPGRGSVFSIEVPLGSAAQQRAETMREQPTPGTDLAGALVVVIDDERAVLDGMGDALGEWGARALLAESLEEARGLLAQAAERPAAIVSDYRLRDRENGIDAIKALQASHGGAIPGILVTGDTAPEHLRAAASSGFHVLHKPIRPAQLHALLRFVVKT
jgi:signal transduction histidine kinase